MSFYRLAKICMFLKDFLYSPGHRVHEQEVVIRRARVLAVVPILLLGCVLDVFSDKFHLFT